MTSLDPAADGEEREAGLEQLKEILVGYERARLEQLEGGWQATEQRVESVEEQVAALSFDARDVARALPEAIRLSTRSDSRLSLALEEPVESAIRRSVNKNPRVLTDAIFPLIGPAIRKAIRESLAGLVEGFNTALEHSLTLRGMRWRVESWRTGRPFSEVVLLHCLVYRVEQLYLIHRESGLLLEHVTGPRIPPQDPDMVSGMLTAIRDFVHDSFDASGPEGELESVQVGPTELLIEPSPKFVLAALVRGRVPEDFRARLRESAEAIALGFANELDEFEGDTTPFLLAREPLERLLVERFVEGDEPGKGRRPFAVVITMIALLAAIAPLVVFLVARSYESGRWKDAFINLGNEPGIVVARIERVDGVYLVHGMRDPDAVEPSAVIELEGLPLDGATFHMDRFRSLEPPIVLARLERRAGEEPGVELSLEGERLVASGRASHAFRVQLERAVDDEPGIFELDLQDLIDIDLERLRATLALVEEFVIGFEPGSATPAMLDSGAALAERFEALAASAEAAERDLRLRVLGSSEEGGASLALERATHVRDYLEGLSLGPRIVLELRDPELDAGLEPGRVVRFVALDRP